jgi:hypothetical protein
VGGAGEITHYCSKLSSLQKFVLMDVKANRRGGELWLGAVPALSDFLSVVPLRIGVTVCSGSIHSVLIIEHFWDRRNGAEIMNRTMSELKKDVAKSLKRKYGNNIKQSQYRPPPRLFSPPVRLRP